MKNLTKILSIVIAAFMFMSLVACSAPQNITIGEEVAEKTELELFVEENKQLLEDSFVEGFSTSGLSCSCTVTATGTTLKFSCKVDNLDNVPAETAQAMSDAFEPQKAALAEAFSSPVKAENIPITSVVIEICEEDGDVVATLDVPIN